MPETSIGYGALIDPAGTKPESLSEYEHKELLLCLDMIREGPEHFGHALGMLAARFKDMRETSPDELIRAIICDHLSEHADDAMGLLAGRFTSLPFSPLSDSEFKTIHSFLNVLRRGGWIGSWIDAQVGAISNFGPYATPLEMMSSLTKEVKKFEDDIETASEMVKAHPELFPTLAPAPKAEEPPAVQQAAPTARKKAVRAS